MTSGILNAPISLDIAWWWKGQKKVRRLIYRVKNVRRLMWHLCSPSSALIPLPHTAVNNITSNRYQYGRIHIHSHILRICTLTEFHSCQISFRSIRTNSLWWGHRRPVVRAIKVSHAACKDEFRRNPRSYRWSFICYSNVQSKYDKSSGAPPVCCFFDHVSSNINKRWLLLLCYLCVLFHQLASPPGFLVTHIPKGNLVYIYIYIYICPSALFSLPAAGLFSCPRLRGTQGALPDPLRKFGMWPRSVARALGVERGTPARGGIPST